MGDKDSYFFAKVSLAMALHKFFTGIAGQGFVSYSFLSSSSSFFFLWQHALFPYFPTFDFDQTTVTVTGILTTTQAQKIVESGVTMGSLGSKKSLSPKSIKSFRISSIDA